MAVTPSEADLVIFGHKSMLVTPCDIHHIWARLIFNFFHLQGNEKKKTLFYFLKIALTGDRNLHSPSAFTETICYTSEAAGMRA